MGISVRNLDKSFRTAGRQVDVLKGFSCSIPPGQITFITGPNGIGKTVFAECITGMSRPDHGEIEVAGRTYPFLDRHTARRLGIEYMPQLLPRPSALTVLEFLALSSPRRSLLYWGRTIRRAVAQTCETYRFDLPIDLRTRLARLSALDLQKLYLLKALMGGARLFVLDEPTSSLHSNEVATLRLILQELQRRSLTVVVIAHPAQYTLDTGTTKQFTAHGLIEPGQSSRTPTISVETRFSGSRHTYTSTVSLQLSAASPLKVEAGSIISILGTPARDFADFEAALGALCADWLTIEPPNPLFKTSFVSSSALDRSVAPALPLVENCLIDHWWHPGIRRYGVFISRSSVAASLVAPIAMELNVNPRDPELPLSALSGGNRQRLIISRQLFEEPQLFIGSNLFRGLDDDGIRRVVRLIRRRAVAGTAMILLCTRPGIETEIADARLSFSAGQLSLS